MVLVKGKQLVRIEPWGCRFVVSSTRTYINDSPDLVMIMSMLMRRGFVEKEGAYSEKRESVECIRELVVT